MTGSRNPVIGRVAVLLLCCVSPFILRPAWADPAEDRAAVIETMQAWERAVEAHDYETLESFYTQDAIYYPNNAAPLIGRAAIIERNRQRGADSVVQIEQHADDISIHDDLAVYSCIARIDVSRPGSQETTVRYARVLLVMEKGETGEWRIHRDIDNDIPERPD